MRAERLVIDSTVWIAALISPTGTARQLVDIVLDLEIDEPESWNAFLTALVELAQWHEDAGPAPGTSRAADDDKFLALAVTGQADAIIRGTSAP